MQITDRVKSIYTPAEYVDNSKYNRQQEIAKTYYLALIFITFKYDLKKARMESSFIDLRIPYLVTSGPLYQFCQILYLIILKNQNQKLKPQKNEFICHSRCHQSFFLPFFHFSSSYFFLQDVHILMLEFTISIRYIFKHISEAIIHSIVGSGTRSGGWGLNLDHYIPIFFENWSLPQLQVWTQVKRKPMQQARRTVLDKILKTRAKSTQKTSLTGSLS